MTENDNSTTDDTDPDDGPVEITDVAALRALSHPVRLALLDALNLHGSLTPTAAGQMIGESATTCSFHLRQLGKYGFAHRVAGEDKRERPWKLTHARLHFPPTAGAPDASNASATIGQALEQISMDRLHRWREYNDLEPPEWRDKFDQSQFVLWVTADEAEAVIDAYHAIIGQYRGRLTEPEARPAGARAVEILTFAYPIVNRTSDGDDSD